MRKLKFLLFLFTVASIGFTSCKKSAPGEEGPKPENQAQIEAKTKIMGKWKITGAVFVKTVNGVTSPAEVWDFSGNDYYFNFQSDNKVALNYITRTGDYNFSFSEDGKKFTASQTGTSSIVYEVKQNTSTELVLFTTHIKADNTETEQITLVKVQ
ncbi:MAG: DUF5004 domain-containing protein [Sphingobacteriaceae bacterium]